MTVNKWVPEVNTFDSMIVDFEGWISVKGLHLVAGLVILSNLLVDRADFGT